MKLSYIITNKSSVALHITVVTVYSVSISDIVSRASQQRLFLC